MILKPIELCLTKQEFCISKIDNKEYSKNPGNFSKHLNKYGLDLHTYYQKYYSELIPKCLETGLPSNNKVKGYWNLYIPLNKEYKDLYTKIIYAYKIIDRIYINEPEFFTEYLTFEYWISKGYKLSECYKFIHHYIYNHSDSKIYQRLSDNFYDDSWSDECKDRYKQIILNLGYESLSPKYSKLGQIQRGNISNDDINLYYKLRPTSFRDSNIQKENSKRKQQKYTREDQYNFTVRRPEYWMKRGYSYEESIKKVSDIQSTNTIESIMKRTNCSLNEASDIQHEIYNKRFITFSKKPIEEIEDINKRKDSSSWDYCIRKCNFNVKEAEKLFYELIKKRSNNKVPFGRASKESLKVFLPVYKWLRKNGILREDIYLGVNGSYEYALKNNQYYFLYDFTVLSKKLIIEYDGIYWHNELVHERDALKTLKAEENGFTVLRIRSDDQNKLNKINKFLYEHIQIKNSDWGVI